MGADWTTRFGDVPVEPPETPLEVGQFLSSLFIDLHQPDRRLTNAPYQRQLAQ